MAGSSHSFIEVADRIWVARYEWFDVNVTLVGGSTGLAVVDTHSSTRAAGEVIDDIRRLGVGPVTTVVNTHDHFDHVFGNDAFRTAYGDLPIHAHEVAAEATPETGLAVQRRYEADPDDPHRDEILETRIVPADVTFSSARVLDLGDRRVELLHPGRGHTGGDLVVSVPDADVLLAGDLVEESGAPMYGEDSFPLDWPATLDNLLGMTTADSVIVPGHGAPVDRNFVEQQRLDVGQVAFTIEELAGHGVSVNEALAAGEWPFPATGLTDAVRRGYAHLPANARRLPLA
ncbi:MAG: MBL fold metallo-hydrolase [Nocardioides sp.]|uniref:MBL fold metallo-hydrolase n=1 Tax=Nocardioides sp. TaxID=35761 RepID=UPI0039E2C88C